MDALVIRDHEIPDSAPLRIEPGDRVRVGERDRTWPAFVFVTTDDSEGWMPERYLDESRPEATANAPYDSTEIPVRTGDAVDVLLSDDRSGWSWCRARDGREGWVPHSALTSPMPTPAGRPRFPRSWNRWIDPLSGGEGREGPEGPMRRRP